ncbi:MAG: SemiSWEET transporter [Pseudomonadota bacterium]
MPALSGIDLIGGMAGALTTLAFVPQVARTWRTGAARDLSLAWLLIFAAGIGLWLAYGLLIGAWPISVANAVTLALVLSLLWVKLRDRGA